MKAVCIRDYTEQQKHEVGNVLDVLDRLDEQLEPKYHDSRKHPRLGYRSVVTICCFDSETKKPTFFNVWARSLSQGGLSFVHPGKVSVRNVIVKVKSAGEETADIQGVVVRARGVPNTAFWEYGIRFVGRVERASEENGDPQTEATEPASEVDSTAVSEATREDEDTAEVSSNEPNSEPATADA